MKWISIKRMSKILGVSRQTVESRAKAGQVLRKRDTLSGKWVYRQSEELGEVVLQKKYVYLKAKDLYIFNRGFDVQFDCKGTLVRNVQKAYTTDKKCSISDICSEYEITSSQFALIKDAMRFTRSSSPITREEIVNSTEEECANSVIAFKAKEANVQRAIEKKQLKILQKKAQLYDYFDQVLLDKLSSIDWGTLPGSKQEGIPVLAPEHPYAAFVGLSDIHIGKRPHKGNMTLEKQSLGYITAVNKITTRLLDQNGVPEKFYLLIGSDMMHSDNVNLETRRGTPQGGQSIGSFHDQLIICIDMMRSIINMLSSISTVEMVWIPGNHDHSSSLAVAIALKYIFQDYPQVSIDISNVIRKAKIYRGVPLYLDHGHGAKPQTYMAHLSQMLMNSGLNYDLSKAIAFTGHFHRARMVQDEHYGIDHITIPSGAYSDDWHSECGYTLGKKRIAMYKITEEEGLAGIMYQGINWWK